MSRTDRDAPDWVRAEWYEPWHLCHGLSWRGTKRPPGKKCTLAPEPVREHEDWRRRGCDWVPVCDWQWGWRRYVRDGGVPKWFRDHVWTNMIRTKLRSELTRAKQEYNGSGDTDVIPNIDQHHHGAGWLYW